MITTLNQLWHQLHDVICSHLSFETNSHAALRTARDLIELERLQHQP